MASLMNVESFFSALTGGEELEIDFPSDRLFRKIGVYLRLLFAAILIGASFSAPIVCYRPGAVGYGGESEKTEELTAEFVNAFCRCRATYSPLEEDLEDDPSPTPRPTRVFLFTFLPYALIVEALLSFAPYLAYATKTRHIVQPILNEAQDMALLTSGMFEEVKSKPGGGGGGGGEEEEETDPDDDSEDEDNYAKSIQTSLKKRLYAKMALFVGQRLKCLEGYELVDHYNLCHVIIKSGVVLLQLGILAVFVFFSFPFPLRLDCPLPGDLKKSLNATHVTCIFPNNGMSVVFVVVDVVVTLLIPIVSWRRYRRYWRRGFYEDLKRARRLVPPTGLDQFNDFVKHMCTARVEEGAATRRVDENGEDAVELRKEERFVARDVDDIRLTLALLHANVDKFIANKIMTVYASRVDLEASDEMEVQKGTKLKGVRGLGIWKTVARWMRPRLTDAKWMLDREAEVET